MSKLAASAMLLGAILHTPPLPAASTLVHSESSESLHRGEADGVAIGSGGRLYSAPRLARLGDPRIPGQPDHVWALVADAAGNLYLGTGPTGQVVRITPAGEKSVFFSTDTLMVTALTFDGSGNLIAGTSPGGKLYRIRPDGSGELWGETGERYVWSLTRTASGRIYAGTGERGRVMRVSANGDVDTFFDSDDTHIVSLLPAPGTGLYAGGAGRGLVYLIDDDGHGITLFEDELPEVAALALDREQRLLIGLVAPPDRAKTPPALELRLPDGVEVGRSAENLGGLEERSGPTLRGVIEGIPPRETPAADQPRAKLVRLNDGERAEILWSSASAALFCLVTDGDAVLFGTGEPARLHRIDPDGSVALVATLAEGQTTALTRAGQSVFLATSNPPSIYRLGRSLSDPGIFVSRPIDALASARWGAIRWTIQDAPPSGSIELYTRTGNSREPDGTWSGWSPALTDPSRSRVVNPDGRFMQWRARFVPAVDADSRLFGVTVHYQPYNRPPEVRGFGVESKGHGFAEAATFRWSARDPDGDPVAVRIIYRAGGQEEWQDAVVLDAEADQTEPAWTDGEAVWDTSAIREGEYQIRAVASDQASNEAGRAGEVEIDLPVVVVVDRSPPSYELQTRGNRLIGITLSDTYSEIRRLELTRDGKPLFRVQPQDGVYDSKTEAFELELPETPSGTTLRGVDAAGNQVEIPLTP